MYQLILDPGSDVEERIPFTISEADLEDAIDMGRAERSDPFDRQISACAYHMVVERRVCQDERLFDSAWVVVRDGKIIARNAGAMDVTQDDLR